MEGKNLHACSGITMRIMLSTKPGSGSWSHNCQDHGNLLPDIELILLRYDRGDQAHRDGIVGVGVPPHVVHGSIVYWQQLDQPESCTRDTAEIESLPVACIAVIHASEPLLHLNGH